MIVGMRGLGFSHDRPGRGKSKQNQSAVVQMRNVVMLMGI